MYGKIIRNIFISFFVVWCSSYFVAFSQAGESGELRRPRIWTAATGHQLTAVYAGRDGNNIRLKIQNGQIRTILLEKLSEADQRLLNNRMQEESGDGNAAVSTTGKGGRNHPYIKFLTEAKQKRLSPEEGIAYYQHVIDALYEQVSEYDFKYPKDLIKEDNSFNTKYLKRIAEKKKPVSQRKNLLTGEYLATPVYANEPHWKNVAQELRYVLDEKYVTLEQWDTLYLNNDEKLVKFGVCIDRKRSTQEDEPKYMAWYKEDCRDYLYTVATFIKQTDDRAWLLGGVREPTKYGDWTRWCSYDVRKGIFYSLFVLIDQNGKITVRDSELGSLQYFASSPNKKAFLYPRNDDDNHYFKLDIKKFALGRYDLNGVPISLEKLWAGVGNRPKYASESAKPTSKHDDPLNVFAERNIKDK